MVIGEPGSVLVPWVCKGQRYILEQQGRMVLRSAPVHYSRVSQWIIKTFFSHYAMPSTGSGAPRVPRIAVTSQQAWTLSFRMSIQIPCWNSRTRLETDSQSVNMRTIHDYRLYIACLSEVRLPYWGTQCIKFPSADTV